MKYEKGNANFILIGVLCVALVLAMMFGLPVYSVWQQGLSGEADLRKAEQTRKIMIEQAKAEKESATFRADAIAIVGQAAKDFPEYRFQEFLGAFGEAFREGNISQIIYVPTEGMVPITEAYRLHDSRSNQ
jgi:hypothetical protein